MKTRREYLKASLDEATRFLARLRDAKASAMSVQAQELRVRDLERRLASESAAVDRRHSRAEALRAELAVRLGP